MIPSPFKLRQDLIISKEGFNSRPFDPPFMEAVVLYGVRFRLFPRLGERTLRDIVRPCP
jgi:hypothetical protein